MIDDLSDYVLSCGYGTTIDDHLAQEKCNAEWMLEFRNGSFFVNLESDHGGPRHLAQSWPSKEEAERFADQHPWIWYAGGMAVKR